MAEVKEPTTYEEQIEKLRSRGCTISNDDFCKEKLSEISYYRLSAYFLPFKNRDDSYKEGTRFEKVYSIYEFDRKLRRLLFSAIEVIEVALRARLAHYHAMKYGSLGYMDANNFNNKHDPEKFQDNIERVINNNNKVLFVKHHIEKYQGKFPLWVISELFTFGMVSYFYSDLITTDQKAIAQQYNANYKAFASWLKCCTDLRNICAHYGRLYYRIFTAIPAGFALKEREKCRLWGALLVVKALYPSKKQWNIEFIPKLEALFDEYEDNISLFHLAFPKDWKAQLKHT